MGKELKGDPQLDSPAHLWRDTQVYTHRGKKRFIPLSIYFRINLHFQHLKRRILRGFSEIIAPVYNPEECPFFHFPISSLFLSYVPWSIFWDAWEETLHETWSGDSMVDTSLGLGADKQTASSSHFLLLQWLPSSPPSQVRNSEKTPNKFQNSAMSKDVKHLRFDHCCLSMYFNFLLKYEENVSNCKG